jgi:hypothetical protein
MSTHGWTWKCKKGHSWSHVWKSENTGIYPGHWKSENAAVEMPATFQAMECSWRASPLWMDALDSPIMSLQEEELSFLKHKTSQWWSSSQCRCREVWRSRYPWLPIMCLNVMSKFTCVCVCVCVHVCMWTSSQVCIQQTGQGEICLDIFLSVFITLNSWKTITTVGHF